LEDHLRRRHFQRCILKGNIIIFHRDIFYKCMNSLMCAPCRVLLKYLRARVLRWVRAYRMNKKHMLYFSWEIWWEEHLGNLDVGKGQY
jgi:hypothetical protein